MTDFEDNLRALFRTAAPYPPRQLDVARIESIGQARRRRHNLGANLLRAACLVVAVVVATVIMLHVSGRRDQPAVPIGPPDASAAATGQPSEAASTTKVSTSPTAKVSSPAGVATVTLGTTLPAGVTPGSVSFGSATTGFMTAQVSGTSMLLETTDSARTWHSIAPPAALSGAPKITFADATDGWLINGPDTNTSELYATHDGAKTWHKIDVTNPADVATGDDGSVWVTTDCAARCTLLRGQVTSDTLTAVGSTVGGGQVAFMQGTVFVWDPKPDSQPGHMPTAFSMVQGQTISQHQLPCPVAVWSVALVPAAVTGHAGAVELFAVCGSQPGAGSQLKKAYVSYVGGSSWQQVGEPPGLGYVQEAFATSAGFVITGARMGLALSRDGGQTWPISHFDSQGSAGWLGPVWFTEPSHGYVYVGADNDTRVLYQTTDGGVTWHQV